MKHLTIYKYIGIYLLSVLCNACASDYLDTEPTSAVSPATLFEDEDYAAYAINGLEKLMNAQYSSVKLDGIAFNGEGCLRIFYGDYPGSDVYMPRRNYYNYFNGAAHAVSTSLFQGFPWLYYYKVIGNANSVLYYVNPENGAKFKQVYAQALTYRAYCYLQLIQLYAPRWCDSDNGNADGVVLRLDISSEGCPVSSIKACYEQIYADLDLAVKYYQESGITRGEGKSYKANINVAYATYARAALTREDWQTAARYAALARAGYPLMSASDYVKGFNDVTNSEWIWSIFESEESSLTTGSTGARLGYNTASAFARTYPHCIVKELYDRIPPTDIRRSLFLDPEDYAYTKNAAHANANGLAGTALAAHARTLYPDLKSTARIFAYMSFKFKCLGDYALPVALFRSSEMILIEAEADCHLTPAKEEEARQLLLELVRDSGRDPEYTCDKSGEELLDEITFYRRVELWGEGLSWFDLKRRKDSITRLTPDKGGNFWDKALDIAPEDANNWTWMIPLGETDYNDAL